MNFKKILVLLISMSFIIAITSQLPIASATNGVTTDMKEWTFMVYLDADNNLDSAGVDDILEMETVGSTSDVNIVVLFDRWFEECKFNGTAMLYIHKGYNETIWGGWTNEYELNMGDPKTLSWFINYVVEKYPAEKYALIIWDHGGNWEGVCWDWTDNDYLTIPEVAEALSMANVKIDLLAFDACLMAGVEVAYEISLTGNVGILVASEDFVPWDGFPYDLILADLVADPTMDARKLAVCTIDCYIEYYATQDVNRVFVTLSAINLELLNDLVSRIAALSMELVENFGKYRDAITAAKDAADRYWFGFWIQGAYIDLHQFTEKLGNLKPDLRDLTKAILQEWRNVVIYAKCCKGPHILGGAGLTIYFPREANHWYDIEAYRKNVPSFVEDTQWDKLLEIYFSWPEYLLS